MAKIALELEHALMRRRQEGLPGRTASRVIARGEGWTVADVVCTCGPRDRAYEERHSRYTIAVVVAGTFQYRSSIGSGLMTPGSLMLGNEGSSFQCGHQHGEGDRCVAFWYNPEYFEPLAADAGLPRRGAVFAVPRLPALTPLTPLVTCAGAGAIGAARPAWEELAVKLAVTTARMSAGVSLEESGLPLNAEAIIARAARAITDEPGADWSLGRLARDAGLSPYYFLRTFERGTGLTPHQYVIRTRLREAGTRLLAETGKVIDVAFDCGFGDVSNFNRAFRMEFSVSPRVFRRTSC